MKLAKKYPKEVRQILAKYPPEFKRSAVMPLLYLAQREEGYIPKSAMEDIAETLEMTVTDVGAVVGFYTLYHDRREGRYRMQVCTDLPCALRGADQFMDSLCVQLGIKAGETTSDQLLTLEEVTCLAACNRAPMFQIQSRDRLEYHENMTVDNTMKLVDDLRSAEGQAK